MSSSGYKFYDPKQGKFKKGDFLLIPFGDLPSLFQVQSARGKKLIVVVIEDNYEKSPIKSGTVWDISKAIYEGYWCHRHIEAVQPKSGKVQKANP